MLLGVIGDDFTGSSDIANNLKKAGMSVGMYSGVPDNKMKLNKYNAVVIALKTRTIPIKKAISESVKALEWLKSKKCKKIIFKYCSTFDSTKKGNIGPVIDAIMKNLNVDFTIACPSFPDAGRTLYQGHMFVNGVPLNESGMENHPLTHMTDHNLVRWLNYQTKGKGTMGKKWVSIKGNFFASIFFELKKNMPKPKEFSLINPLIIKNAIKDSIYKEEIKNIIEIFLNTSFEGGRHTNRINKIKNEF